MSLSKHGSEDKVADIKGLPEHDVDWSHEQKLLRKLDWTLIPLFMAIYCTNFVDRTAVGNAKIAGLEKDLGMKGKQYNIALTVFYIGYILVEVPSNLVLKRVGSVWLAALVLAFGIVSVGTAFIHNFGQLVVTRLFLGLAEGGTLSGLAYLMSRYYRRSELVLRLGIFFGCAPALAGAFGGLLASGLLKIDDFGPLITWRKIFFVEGIITCGIGLLCFFIIPDDPRKAKFLSEPQRKLALARIEADQVVKTGGKIERTRWALIRRALNFNICLYTFAYILLNISFQGLSLFMPTVVATLGHYTTVQNQLRTVPPYLVASVYSIVTSFISFRFKNRSFPITFGAFLMIIGYAIAVGSHNAHARYAACFISIAGASPTGPLLLVWGADNTAPETVRAVALALIPGIGTIGAVIAVWSYLPTDAPNYHKGNSLNLATSITATLLGLVGYAYAVWENAKRERGDRDYRVLDKTEEELQELGWMHPKFRYQT